MKKTLLDYEDKRSDKNSSHSYLDLYQNLLESRKETATNVLEIGIGNLYKCNGGSIKMWYNYFTNATVHALDVNDIDFFCDDIKDVDRIKLYTSIDAYNEFNFNNFFFYQDIRFDMVLDDGPHSLESMITFIKLYLKVLKPDGVLIIEDIPDLKWTNVLKQVVPDEDQKYVKIYDLRHIKNTPDDIVFVIDRKA